MSIELPLLATSVSLPRPPASVEVPENPEALMLLLPSPALITVFMVRLLAVWMELSPPKAKT